MGSLGHAPSGAQVELVIVNPLAAALQHYTAQLEKMLARVGIASTVLAVTEPSVSGGGRMQWLQQYLRALREARKLRKRGARIVVTWPVLGHIDRLLVPFVTGSRQAVIVMHDPRPLVRAVGYGRGAVILADLIAAPNSLIVHSDLAADEMPGRRDTITRLPHPLVSEVSSRALPTQPVVRVLGQWKPDRDLELLRDLASLLSGVSLEIIGRGWPPVDGWAVRDEFVPEVELDRLLRSSTAVLIPYRRYYQSGIAARAIELAVPVVGGSRELSTMTGADYPFLVPDGAAVGRWADAVQAALASPAGRTAEVSIGAGLSASAPWREWVRS